MHWARKIWHVLGVCVLAMIGHFFSPLWTNTVMLGLWLLFVPVDFLRLRSPALNDFLMHLFRPIMRQTEAKALAGTSYLLTGVLVISLLFPREIVLITLLYLAFADPMASVVGIRWGRDKIFGHKSVQGSAAAFLICTLITFLALTYEGIFSERILMVSILGGLIGACAEAIPIGPLDDNFSIPVLSSAGLWILFMIFGGFAGA